MAINRLEHHLSLEKGFELAYFLSQDREIALEVLVRALDKLSVHCRREKRRFYWRYNHAGQPIRRITHQELDAFQWLIMLESEPYEKAQEKSGAYSSRDMVVRYIKHLVQITMSMSSFYVCVGINRLLYSYSTSETQAVFELVTERFIGADQYRRAKKMLTSQLSERFGELVETVRTRHGEIRFKAQNDQSRWYGLIHECLSMFSPWSTEGCCERLMAETDTGAPACAPAVELDHTGADAQETACCHIFIEPMCRGKLLTALSFPPPEARLALPKFGLKEQASEVDNNQSQGPRERGLSEGEERLLFVRLEASQSRHRRFRPDPMNVVADGREYSRMDLENADPMQIGHRCLPVGRDATSVPMSAAAGRK
jgi:hypothetical protein